MKKTVFLAFIFSVIAYSQKAPHLTVFKTQEEKLKNWLIYCNSVSSAENYQQLINVADQGIRLAKNNEIYLAKFYFFKGYGYEYNNNQYAEAVACFEKSLYYARKNKLSDDETSALMRLNYNYYSNGNFAKRDQLARYIKKVLDTTKSNHIKAVLNGSLGEYHLDNANYEKFIGYKLKAIEYLKKLPKSSSNDEKIGTSYAQITDAYIQMKQYNKAIEYMNSAASYTDNSPYGKAYNYYYYIQCYVGLKKIDSIKKYYKAIYNVVTPKDSLHFIVSRANRVMAEYYLKNNSIEKANLYANKALVSAIKSNDSEVLIEANTVKGFVFYEQKQYKEAIQTLEIANKNAKEFGKEFYSKINKKISESYAALGVWKKAYEHDTIYSKYNSELLQESAKQSIANAEARYQNNTKKQEIKNLSAQNTIKNIQIEDAREQRLFLISGILLIGIIGLLLFRQNQNRKKTNQKLQLLNQELDEANKIKARFFGILNHDLRSPISNLIHFLHLQKENPELIDEETALRMQAKIISGAENLLSSMEDILLWSKGQMENFKPHFKKIPVEDIFEDTKKHFSALENIEILFENPENIILDTDENYLKTIIRNLTGNAVKALDKTGNPKIIWKAWQEENQTYLSITDNGPGESLEKFKALYDDSQVIGIKSGLGLHLIRDLATAINCKIEVSSKLNFGTTFTILFQ